MQIPSYKKIHLNSSSPELIAGQLDQLRLTECPYLINITHLEDSEFTCLNSLADYVEKRPQASLPYGLYIMTHINSHPSSLYLVADEEQLPKFFKIKDRSLNNKEVALYQRLELLRTNLKNINIHAAQTRLKVFSKEHKKVNSEYKELEFYQRLLTKMKI